MSSVLDQCKKINLTLNKDKCVFKVKEVTYIGHKLKQEGIKPDDVKVRAIEDMPTPTDKKGVERFLGTVNYLGKFIPNLATATEPIRVLRERTLVTWTRQSLSRNNEYPNRKWSPSPKVFWCAKTNNCQLRCLTYRPWRSVTKRW